MDSNANVVVVFYRGALRDSNELSKSSCFPGSTSTLVCIFFLYFQFAQFALTAQTCSSVSLSDICLNLNFITILFMILFVFFPNYTLKFNTNLQLSIVVFLEKLHFEQDFAFAIFLVSQICFDKK